MTDDPDQSDESGPTRIAIACQGGGSHTAFTAGVLRTLLPAIADSPEYELNALSGTSGGAVCSTLAWYGHHPDTEADATALLDEAWTRIAAMRPDDYAANWAGVRWATLRGLGAPLPEVAPSHPTRWLGSVAARHRMRRLLDGLVAFEAFGDLAAAWEPDLYVGAVDVIDGSHETFKNGRIGVDEVLASMAHPALFPAVVREEDGHGYWDGLFSHNPPIREFLADEAREHREEKPDRIWIVRVNPRNVDSVPTDLAGIADRRNELAGNLSLEQEVAFVRQVNDWLEPARDADGEIIAPPVIDSSRFKPVHIDYLGMAPEVADGLDTASKLNRDPAFLDCLLAHGRERAAAFLADRGVGSS